MTAIRHTERVFCQRGSDDDVDDDDDHLANSFYLSLSSFSVPLSFRPVAVSSEVVAVACEDRTMSVFSSCGRRLIPSILLPAPISTLHCSGWFVMALTAAATLSVW